MEDSPISLDKWLIGMWLIASAKNGISSYELHRALGITQKSAWFLGHRIRFALQPGTMEKLSDEVEADETMSAEKFAICTPIKDTNTVAGRYRQGDCHGAFGATHASQGEHK